MGIIMLEDVKKIVENFKENAPDGSIYLIVKKEFVDGMASRLCLHYKRYVVRIFIKRKF